MVEQVNNERKFTSIKKINEQVFFITVGEFKSPIHINDLRELGNDIYKILKAYVKPDSEVILLECDCSQKRIVPVNYYPILTDDSSLIHCVKCLKLLNPKQRVSVITGNKIKT